MSDIMKPIPNDHPMYGDTAGPRQNNTEVKLQAALLLLDTITTLLIKHIVSEGGDPTVVAEAHRDAFIEATKNHPEVYAAGMEIAHQFAENGGYELDA